MVHQRQSELLKFSWEICQQGDSLDSCIKKTRKILIRMAFLFAGS